MFEELIRDKLVWFPELDIGYYPVCNSCFDDNYYEIYRQLSKTKMGKEITSSRVNLVNKYYDGVIIDVGIGYGQFIKQYKKAVGYDVNPHAIKWLEANGIYSCLYDGKYKAATFWDSLEHIKNPEEAIKQIKEWVFISIPIFANCNTVLSSKHFKKDEHYWYFTHHGLISWFSNNGFECVEYNQMEIDLGREGIGTYVFRRKNA